MDHFCYLCFMSAMLSCTFLEAPWSPAGKGLTYWLSCICDGLCKIACVSDSDVRIQCARNKKSVANVIQMKILLKTHAFKMYRKFRIGE